MIITKYTSRTCIKCRTLNNDWENIKENHPNWDFNEICIDDNPEVVDEIVAAGLTGLPVIKFENKDIKIYNGNILTAKDFEEFVNVPF